MKQLLIIALAIAAPAYGQMTDEPVTDEQRGSLEAYHACLYGYAREIDDGAAPAILARKVAPHCRFQLGITASILARDGAPAERDALYRKGRAQENQQAVEVILTVRRDRRAMTSDPASPTQGRPPVSKPAAAKPVATNTVAPAAAAKAIPATGPDGKPISAWRRAYIASHGHEPPVPAR